MSNKTRTIGIVPARGGSKGIPKKNLTLLNGKPLIQYTLDAAKNSRIDKLVVSTDDYEIKEYCLRQGVEVIQRPEDLAMDSTPTRPVLEHVIESINEKFDFVITLQPTSPLRESKHIDEALELMSCNPKADSLVSVVQTPHNHIPQGQMIINEEGFLKNVQPNEKELLRRQDKPIYYSRNGAAIYITKTFRLKEYIFGGNLVPYIMDKLYSIDIDDAEDLWLAELILKNR